MNTLQSPIIQLSQGEHFCIEAFQRVFRSNVIEQFNEFKRRLDALGLDFVFDKLRRDDFPPYPGMEQDMVSYRYYVPGANFDHRRSLSPNPNVSSFTTRIDGFGQNIGCPLRLAKALERLEAVEPQFDGLCSNDLRTQHKHLPIVEELLWADAWISEAKIDRNTNGQGNKRPDWRLTFSNCNAVVYVECKFLPSDWMRLVDGIHEVTDVLKKAAEQLPKNKSFFEMNVVAITGVNEIDEEMRNLLVQQLDAYPHIDAVIFRGLLTDTWIISLDKNIAKKIRDWLSPQSDNDFQSCYLFTWSRSDKEMRDQMRCKNSLQRSSLPQFFEERIAVKRSGMFIQKPPPGFGYAANVISYEPDGEPIFNIIPSHSPGPRHL